MFRRSANKVVLAAGIATAILLVDHSAWANRCRPRKPLPPIVLTSMGPCFYDPESASFTGDPAQQTRCLLRPVGKRAKLGPPLESLPSVLADRVGRSTLLPERRAIRAVLAELDLEKDFGESLFSPVARARDGDPFAPAARYFVIHDTSGPNLRGRSWPQNLDGHPRFNNLAGFHCSDGWEIAHVIINRSGAMLVGHGFEIPWRATKFERATRFGTDLKGLFLHIELIQPRRGRAGIVAPRPGFSAAQYDRLALLYVIASVRAGQWLIPAFHATIDADIRNGHDDPQNFDVDSLARSLETLAERLDRQEPSHAEIALDPATVLHARSH